MPGSNDIPQDARQRLGLVEEEESKNGNRPNTAASGFNLTDLGNAERMVARHGDDLRYVHAWGRWLIWTGQQWEIDSTGEVHRRAKETVREIYNEAAEIDDSATRKNVGNHAMKSESGSRLEAMISLSQSEEGIPVQVEDLDANSWLLNVENGTLDLTSGDLREHRRGDLITKLSPIEYDPDATAPTWEAFLERVLPGEELREFVQRVTGYSLTADTRERILLILYGMGRNGKSTLLETIRAILGDEHGYAVKTPAETLMAKPSGGIPNDVARLKGARFVAASETEANRRLAESTVKEITGNDTISARFMRGEWFDFRPTHKVWLATNHKPQVNGTDPAIWDRIKLIPFEIRIPDEEVDPKLPEKLQDEFPGILAWAVQGCLDWQREGLREPDEVKAATDEYRNEQDVLAAFIDERCVVSPNAWTPLKDLYETYTEWCEESNEKAEKKRAFADRLTERGFEAGRGTDNVAIRRGIGLRTDGSSSGDEGPEIVNPGGPGINHDTPTNPSTEAATGSRQGGVVNSEDSGINHVNSPNPHTYRENGVGINQDYPESGISGSKSSREDSIQNEVNSVNSLIPEDDEDNGDKEGPVTRI